MEATCPNWEASCLIGHDRRMWSIWHWKEIMMADDQQSPRKGTFYLRWRWYPLPAAYLSLILAFYIGATTSLSSEDAASLAQFWEQLFSSIKNPIDIFLNNSVIALIMVVPLLGALFAMYVGYNSGLVISAMSQANKVDPVGVLILTVANPIAFMEFMAYALSITEGILIAYAIVQRHLRQEIRNAAITIVIVLVILIVEAFLEFGLVKGFLNL